MKLEDIFFISYEDSVEEGRTKNIKPHFKGRQVVAHQECITKKDKVLNITKNIIGLYLKNNIESFLNDSYNYTEIFHDLLSRVDEGVDYIEDVKTGTRYHILEDSFLVTENNN